MCANAKTLQNIGIFAHIDAGKTTVTEQLLFLAGRVHFAGSVEDGSTVTDWQQAEQRRGITIGSAAVRFNWNHRSVTVVDTPGHVDFTVEVERTLRVIEGGIVVISGPDGIQAQTQTVWNLAARRELPVIGFLNRLDRLGVDMNRIQTSIRRDLGIEPLPLHLPTVLHGEPDTVAVIDVLTPRLLIWEAATTKSPARKPVVRPLNEEQELEQLVAYDRIIDMVTAVDDGLAERVLAGESISRRDVVSALGAAVRARACFPLLAGAARTGAGLYALADAIVELLPHSGHFRPQPRFNATTGRALAPLGADASDGDIAAFTFKTEVRRDGQRLAYVRVFAGRIQPGMSLTRLPSAQPYTIGSLVHLFGGSEEVVDELGAGEIGGIITPSDVPGPTTGETLLFGESQAAFETLKAPRPVIGMTFEAPDAAIDSQLRQFLNDLTLDDPSLTLGMDSTTGLLVLNGMGELHLELARERVCDRFSANIRVGMPRPARRRMPSNASEATVTVRGGVAPSESVEIRLMVRPGAPSSGPLVLFPSELEAHPARALIEAGIESALQATATDPSFTAIEVQIMSLRTSAAPPLPVRFLEAARQAATEAIESSGAVVAEPWMALRLVVPETSVGTVVGDLSRRRGGVTKSEALGPVHTLYAEAPLVSLIGYATDFRSLTGGRGVFSMELKDYRQAG